MAITQKLVTSNFNTHNAGQFVESFTEPDGNRYYMYAARHIPWVPEDSSIETPTNSVEQTHIQVYDDMIFAKKIESTDVIRVIPKNLWQEDTVYDQYDHRDSNLKDKQFYVTVDDSTEYNVYKCLFNNGGANSTVAPSKTGSLIDLDPFITGDGYIWKYMYTVTKTDYEKFSTIDYIPVTPNTAIIEGSTPGTIETIIIEDGGSSYNNYFIGTFRTGDIRYLGQDTFFLIEETAVPIDDYYQDCVIKITSSSTPDVVDQYKRIVNYEGTGAQKVIILESGFTYLPSVGDTYEIYPYVNIYGDGNETTKADARAIINSSAGNTVSQIEILNPGVNYRKAIAVINPNPAITGLTTFESANLTPIISPKGGHGSDPINELFANRVCISIKFNQSEGTTIPTQNDFRSVGIIKDPLFTNVDFLLEIGNTVGSFNIGETVKQYKGIKLAGNVSITSGTSSIIKTDFGKLANTITISSPGNGYNSTVNSSLVFTGGGGSGASGTFANNGNGEVTSVTVTNQGSNYTSVPTISINTSAGANATSTAVLNIQLQNPIETKFKDAFSVNDYVLISNGTYNSVFTVSNVPEDYSITTTSNSTITLSNFEIYALKFDAEGIVTSISTGQITLSNVSGPFSIQNKVIGLSSSTTSVIRQANTTIVPIQVNDKDAVSFRTASQLTRLVGTYSSGETPFFEDEKVVQDNLISFVQPSGYVHHIDENVNFGDTVDDVLYISREYGIFNKDTEDFRTITGTTSGATLSLLSNKYPGDFVKGSGEVLYFENLDPITRSGNKSEIIKIILDF